MIRWIGGGTAGVVILLAGATGAAGLDLPGRTSPATAAGPMVLPITSPVITQGFGCTPFAFEPIDAACPSGHWHSGLDLAAPLGTPVHAAIGGLATVVTGDTGYGLHVVVDGVSGTSTLYGHLSAAAVTTGSVVERDQIIGSVGSSGNSTGPHLHFEVRRRGIPEDPAPDLHLQ